MDKAVTKKKIEACVRELNACVVKNTEKLDHKLEELKTALKKIKEQEHGIN